MKTLIALVAGQTNAGFPPIMAAAMVYRKAHEFQCDRIRVEKLDGALVAEFPLPTVAGFLRRYRLVQQPDRLARQGREWELHRPVWPGLTPPRAAKEIV